MRGCEAQTRPTKVEWSRQVHSAESMAGLSLTEDCSGMSVRIFGGQSRLFPTPTGDQASSHFRRGWVFGPVPDQKEARTKF